MSEQLAEVPTWESIWRRQVKRDGTNEVSQDNYTAFVLTLIRDWASELKVSVVDSSVEFQNRFHPLAVEMGKSAAAFAFSAADQDGLLKRILQGGEDDIHQSPEAEEFWNDAKKVMYAAYGKPLSVEARHQAKQALPAPAATSISGGAATEHSEQELLDATVAVMEIQRWPVARTDKDEPILLSEGSLAFAALKTGYAMAMNRFAPTQTIEGSQPRKKATPVEYPDGPTTNES